MRRTIVMSVLTSLALAGSAVALAPPATAHRPDDTASSSSKAALQCGTGVVSLDRKRAVRYQVIDNDKVVDTFRGRTKLSFRATAWGLYDSQETKQRRTLRLNTVATNGTPRRVSLTFKNGSAKIAISSSRYDQKRFEPELFADSYGFYAYAVRNGKLQRWTLTRYRNGDLRFAQKVTIGTGYGDLTSLQASATYKTKGSKREILYATTETGALHQIVVPLNNAAREKRRTLLAAGYAGVTELVWSYCNNKPEYTSLVAIDPVTGVATWTTVQNAVADPDAQLRGAVTGGRWTDIVATY